MNLLVDANVLIDYVDGKPYAKAFFEKAKRKSHMLIIPLHAYAEAERITNHSKKLEKLSAELHHYGLLEIAEPKESEWALAEKLVAQSKKIAGRDIGPVDRLIVSVAVSRGLVITTRDKMLDKLGKSLGAKLAW